MAKLLGNTFRHVNIALVNELATFAHDLDVDVREAIDAAAAKPHGFLRFLPGPGAGGHCLPIDPSCLSWWAERTDGRPFRFVELADGVNGHMPDYVVPRLTDGLRQRGKEVDPGNPRETYAAVVPAWIDAVTTGQQVLVHGDGLRSRDFTYVETVCRVLTRAALRKVVSADPVNLAYGTRTSLGELITELEAVLGTPLDPRHLPPRPGDVRHSHAENSRLLSLLPRCGARPPA